jgi:Ras of Complex, Roc, domain of DAPkinase
MELCRACCRRLCCLKGRDAQEVEHTDDAATLRSAKRAKPAADASTTVRSSQAVAVVDKLVRIVIVGETRVGKTSLMRRYLNGYFDGSTELNDPHSETLGVDFGCKNIDIGGVRVRLQGWFIHLSSLLALLCHRSALLLIVRSNSECTHVDDPLLL